MFSVGCGGGALGQVESSCDEFPSCANCDRNEKSPMFFCNTCGESGVTGDVCERGGQG